MESTPKYSALDNFKYGEDYSNDAYLKEKARREAAEKAFIEEDNKLTERLNRLLANCQKARKEIEESKEEIKQSEDNCNKEMDRINKECNMIVAFAVADMAQNGVTGEFVHQLASGKFHKAGKKKKKKKKMAGNAERTYIMVKP